MDLSEQYIITLPDLVYAALLSYVLDILHVALSQEEYIVAAYIVFSAILMGYDWYGEHSTHMHYKMGTATILVSFSRLISYFLIFFFSNRTSFLYTPLVGLRALIGIIENSISLRVGDKKIIVARLKSFNISSPFMVVAYSIVFVVELFIVGLQPALRLGLVVSIWLIAYMLYLSSADIQLNSEWWLRILLNFRRLFTASNNRGGEEEEEEINEVSTTES